MGRFSGSGGGLPLRESKNTAAGTVDSGELFSQPGGVIERENRGERWRRVGATNRAGEGEV